MGTGEDVMSMASALDQVRAVIDQPRLLCLLDYWLGKRVGDALPGRADIDPLEMTFILGNLLMVDVEREPLRFRYRLVGSNLSQRLHLDLTGRTVDEHPDPTFRRLAIDTYTDIARTGEPRAARRDQLMDGRLRHYQVLLLPLAADGRTVDKVMVGTCFELDLLPAQAAI